jgi:serine/threonine protein phosphatase PrpC
MNIRIAFKTNGQKYNGDTVDNIRDIVIFFKESLPEETEKDVEDFVAQYSDKIQENIRAQWDEYRKEKQKPDVSADADETVEAQTTSEIPSEPEEKTEPAETVENPQKQGAEFQTQADREEAKEKALAAQIKDKNISLPNGKVKKEYSARFDLETLGASEISEFWFEGLEELGLKYIGEEKRIAGIPKEAGDYTISLKCKRKDWSEGKPVFERRLNLFINPDPRSLWNDIPTPKDIEYFKPDEDKLFVKVASKTTGGFLGLGKKETIRKDMVAASQRGRSHAHEGKARDDDFRLHFDEPSEWYIMAVADGAGSAKYSRRGSEIACETVIEVCLAKIAENGNSFEDRITAYRKDATPENRKKIGDALYRIIGDAAFKSLKKIEEEAQKEKVKAIKDFSTTLIISLSKKFEFGWFTGAFWVGDGGIGIYDKDASTVKILGEPDGGEFAGQTRFITMPEVMQPAEIYRRLRFDIVSDFTALILMTDGVTDPKFETDANLKNVERWHQLWADLNGENEDSLKVDFSDDNEQTADQLLKWLDFWSKGNHDDRTIAILV